MATDTMAKSYDAGFIVLSYFVSLIGAITTLELLHRRTSTKGVYNWFLLLASCVTMGGCGIWAMHFIGNRATILGGGSPPLQIRYSSGFTSLSFFLPIVVLLMAFYLLGSASQAKPLSIVFSGVLTGTAVCGMHYIGNYGITNYHCHYDVGHVIGSAIIAVAASVIALSVFFRLRDRWTDSWWKRALCAAVLACAVSGMHWTAAVGTTYRIREGSGSLPSGTNRTQTVIICSALSLAACIVLLVVVLIRGKKIRLTRTRAQQLVLACAYFDETGRVMLTSEGALPCQKITNRFVEKTFGEDELSRAHPTFMWVFRASRNWPALKELIPNMMDHLDSNPTARRYTPAFGTLSVSDDASEISVEFSAIFKQLFCVAAQQLANIVHEPLEKLGILFEEPLETGVAHLSRHDHTLRNLSHSSKGVDVESQKSPPHNFGRGKYLFVNRRLNKADVAKFAALGYRFGSIAQVSELLARSMEVADERIRTRLERMKICASLEHLPPPGVHLAAFMLRPSIHKSFDILVPEKTQNHLPYSSMQIDRINEWQSALLERFNEWTIKEILRTLINESGSLEPERDFRWDLHSSFIRLIDLVGDTDSMMNAVFSANHIEIPCRPILIEPQARSKRDSKPSTPPQTCTLLTIRLMNTIHAKPLSEKMTYIPLSFFSAQQQIDTAGPNYAGFAKKLKSEFGYQPTPTPPPATSGKDSVGRHSFGDSIRQSRDIGSRDSMLKSPNMLESIKVKALHGHGSPLARTRASARTSRDDMQIMREDAVAQDVSRSDSPGQIPVDEGDSSYTSSPVKDEFGLDTRRQNRRHGDVELVSLPDRIERQGAADDGDAGIVPDLQEKAGWVSDLFGLFRL